MNIPLLTEQDIECRVQSVKKNKAGKAGAVLLLYKDARVDMRILDLVYGNKNWQRTHEVINGNLFCNIDIWDDDKKSWVRKQDVGTESNTEKEKGQASDSFKRAGFNIGIGRELYTAPFVYVELNDSEYYGEGDKIKCSPYTVFSVKQIGYNERREVTSLTIVDGKGIQRYRMGVPPKDNELTKKPEEVPNVPINKAEPKEISIEQLRLDVLDAAKAKGVDTERAKAVLLKNTGKSFEELTAVELLSSITGFKNMKRTATT